MATAETGDLNDLSSRSPPKSNSPIPRLGEGFSDDVGMLATPQGVAPGESPEDSAAVKSNKRRLFGFGRKKNGEADPLTQGQEPRAISPHASTHPYQSYHSPTSPHHFRSASPGIPSPASSQIFERDVQESSVPSQASPAIPAHIQTEHHIPPVLEASSLAITDGQLNPDNVEIVMHAAHQPAAVTVTGAAGSSSEATGTPWSDDLLAHPDKDDAASNYGALDSTDVRRLSFISFADVVQSEHADHANNADFSLPAGLSSAAPHFASADRSPSPVRSPGSSHGLGTTPPTSVPTSIHGLDGSPRLGLRGPGSPTSAYSPPHAGGELTIETMRQALRKTGSGDLSGSLSQPMSAVSADENLNEHNSWRQQ